jgi:tripartite-type tricarboxylate transporter receptor subunit TctC
MGQWLSDRLGQPFIVENRAGASGNIGTEAVAKAPADGYTLLQIVTPHAINAALYTNLSFEFIRDIAPVICAARLAYVVVVNPSVSATDDSLSSSLTPRPTRARSTTGRRARALRKTLLANSSR